MTDTQTKQRGALILTWRQSSPDNAQQVSAEIARSMQYFQTLEDRGDITSHRVWIDLNAPCGQAVLEGQIDKLVALTTRPDHRSFLLRCQSTLPHFTATTAIGGSDNDLEEALVQMQVQYQPASNKSMAGSR